MIRRRNTRHRIHHMFHTLTAREFQYAVDNIFFFVVDDVLGSQCCKALKIRGGAGDDFRPFQPGQLYGKTAYCTSTGRDEQPLTGLKCDPVPYGLPGGDAGTGYGGGRFKRQPVGQGRQGSAIYTDVFGKRTGIEDVNQAKHRIAHPPVSGLRPHFRNNTCSVDTDHPGQWQTESPARQLVVDRIQTGGHHAYFHLLRSAYRRFDLPELQQFIGIGLIEYPGFHDLGMIAGSR